MKNFWSKVMMLGLLLAAANSLAGFEESARGRNKRMFVLPPPGHVVVDGQLDDWDMTGAVYTCVDNQAADTRSARLAAMYDDQALYLAGEVVDATPMVNRNDPRSEGDKGWNADALQIRFLTNPERGHPVWGVAPRFFENHKNHATLLDADEMLSLTLWYYTDDALPCLQMSRGLTHEPPRSEDTHPFGVLPNQRYQAVYRPWPRGDGYTFEYRIPWQALEMQRPLQAGDLVPGTFQLNWGTVSGIGTPRGAWAYDLQVCLGFPWQSTESYGKLIFSPHGNLPPQASNVLRPVFRDRSLAFRYNLDRESEVTLVIEDAERRTVRRLLAQARRPAGEVIERWDGRDDGGSLLPPGEYAWRGIRFDPLRTEYVVGVNNSGTPSWQTEDSRGGWGGDHGKPAAVALAGQRLILAWDCSEGGSGIIGCDLEGRKQWGVVHQRAEYLAGDGTRVFLAGGHFGRRFDDIKVMSAENGRSLTFAKTGKTAAAWDEDRETPPRINGLAYADGRLYASFGEDNRIVQYDADTGELLALFELPQPGHLAVTSDGALLVVSEGKIVRVDGFQRSTATGSNRQQSTAIELSMLIADHLDDPQGIAVGADGTIYVANCGALQNVSVFDANGNYLRSIGKAGGRPAVGRFEPDGMRLPHGLALDGKNRLWVAEMEDAPKRVSVWNAATGELERDFFGAMHYKSFGALDRTRPDELINDGVIWKIDLEQRTWHPHSTIYRNTGSDMFTDLPQGKTVYGTAVNGRQYGLWDEAVVMIREGDVFRPLAAVIGKGRDGRFPVPALNDNPDLVEAAYLWYDTSGDGRVQIGELTPASALGERKIPGFLLVDREWALWGNGFVLRPREFKADGTPVYDFSTVEDTRIRGGLLGTSLVRDPVDGGFYTVRGAPRNAPLQGRLLKLSETGEELWNYPAVVDRQAGLTFAVPAPGYPTGVTCILQMQGDMVAFGTWTGAYHLFTRDGLYVANLFKDQRLGVFDQEYLGWELYGGTLMKETAGTYLLSGGDTDARVTRIHGLETLAPMAGTLTITAADVERAADADRDYRARQARAQTLFIARGRQSLEEIRLRGVIPAIGLTRTLDAEHGFTVHAARDHENLYLLLKVTSPTAFVATADSAVGLPAAGNVAELLLATGGDAAPRRQAVAAGDLRLLFSRTTDGQPLGLLQRVDPAGRIESAEVGDRLLLTHRQGRGGFETLATIPLELLGWQPTAASTVRMDVGYAFGSRDGDRCEVRGYWYQTAAESGIGELRPAHWGLAVVE